MQRTRCATRRGITRTDVGVAAALLAAVAGLLVPAVQKSREAAVRVTCQNNLKLLALAAHSFHAGRQRFPSGEIAYRPQAGMPPQSEYYTCWVIPLLPFIGESGRARAMAETTGFEDRHRGGSLSLYGSPVRVLICPADALPATGAFEYHAPDVASPTYDPKFPAGRYDAVCSYGANWGTQTFQDAAAGVAERNGVFHYDTRTRVADITDGVSCTILLGERSHGEPRWRFMGFSYPAQQNFAAYSRWYTGGMFTGRQPHERINYRLPAEVERSPPPQGTARWEDLFYKRVGSYGSEHPGGCNLALADGSVRFVADRLTLSTLRALSTKAGGEPVHTE